MKHDINKSVAVLLVALLPSLAGASDVAELQTQAQPKAVVSVVASNTDTARELAAARDEYRAQAAQLRAAYQARIDAVLAGKAQASES